MKMEYFESEHFMGFPVDNVSDAMKAHEIGLNLVTENCDIIGYDIEDKDGNERPMTDDEICQDVLKALENSFKVYAGSFLDSGTFASSADTKTILESNYRVGQQVFLMLNNKIIEGKINCIEITTFQDGTTSSEYEVHIPSDFTYKKFKESDFFTTKEELIKHLMEG